MHNYEFPNGFCEISPGLLEHGIDAWVKTPLNLNKYLLVSWRMSGSEFCKEVLRENFSELSSLQFWAKSHILLNDKFCHDLNNIVNTKVFVIITDPREVACNLVFFDNGFHFQSSEYKSTNKLSSSFLGDVTDKQIELIKHYKNIFKDNCIVLRYEDAVFNQQDFLNSSSTFLNQQPLFVDNVKKYKWSAYKNVGGFHHFYDQKAIDSHYENYQDFFKEYNYPKEGLQYLKYTWDESNDITKFSPSPPPPPPPKII